MYSFDGEFPKNIHLRSLRSNLPRAGPWRWIEQTQPKTRGGATNKEEDKEGDLTSIDFLKFKTQDCVQLKRYAAVIKASP